MIYLPSTIAWALIMNSSNPALHPVHLLSAQPWPSATLASPSTKSTPQLSLYTDTLYWSPTKTDKAQSAAKPNSYVWYEDADSNRWTKDHIFVERVLVVQNHSNI